jgi:hypothetical protein
LFFRSADAEKFKHRFGGEKFNLSERGRARHLRGNISVLDLFAWNDAAICWLKLFG